MTTTALNTLLAATLLVGSNLAQATIVEVTTNLGKFEINLFDQTTPVTVQNFLSYVSSGRYDGTVIHRSVPGFVIQGGGFTFDQQLPLKAVASNAAIALTMTRSSTNFPIGFLCLLPMMFIRDLTDSRVISSLISSRGWINAAPGI